MENPIEQGARIRDLRNELRKLEGKRDVTAAGHYAAIACEPAALHFQGSSSSILVFG
jgi:hypothetical protein